MSKETSEVNPENYKPTSLQEVEFVPSPLPERVFEGGLFCHYQPAAFPSGLIVINMIHKDYPDAVCQVQMVPAGGNYGVFFYHGSPTKEYIPDDLAEELAINHAIPHTMREIDNLFPPSNDSH
jgi:hypothetical protein